MQTRVMASGMQATRAVRAFAHRHLSALLGRHVDDIEHADVFLEDVNGPKGGRDMAVRIRTRLRNGRVVLVEDTRDDLHAAIASASRRTAFAIRRALDEARRIDRRAGRRARRETFAAPPVEALSPR